MIEKLDILTVLSREGIDVDLHGRFICPFHDDRSPSGKVWPSSGRWRCFACDTGGDSIDFVMRRHGMLYAEALRHLGIDGPRTPDSIRQEREAKAARERRRRYRETLRGLSNKLSDRLREMYRIRDAWKDYDTDEETRASWAEAIQDIPHIEWKLDRLIHGDEQDRFDIYREGAHGKGK